MREVVVGARRIISEKIREHQYKGRYARSVEGKEVEWDRKNNAKRMRKLVKRAAVESEREVCG